MKTIYIPVLIVISAFQFAYGQTSFQKYYMDSLGVPIYIVDGKACTDGGAIMGGAHTVTKVSSSGNVEWAKNISVNCPVCDNSYEVHAVGEIPGSGYYALVGIDGMNQIFALIKMDMNGTILWTKFYNSNQQTSFYDYSRVTVLPNGEFILSLSLYKGAIVQKSDANGDIIWSNFYATDTTKSPSFESVALTDGSVVTACKGDCDVVIVATSSTGNVTWSRRLMNGGIIYNQARSIISTLDGNILVTGFQQDDLGSGDHGFLMKLDMSGNILWNKLYSAQDEGDGLYFNHVRQFSNSNYLISGSTDLSRAYLLTVDNDGNIINSNSMGETTLGPSWNWYTFVNILPSDHFICFADYYLIQASSPANISCNAFYFPVIVTDDTALHTNNISTALIQGTGCIATTGNASFSIGIVVANEYCSIVGIEETKTEIGIRLAPNPATDELFFSNFSSSEKTEITVYNSLGEKIFSKEFTSGEKEIKLDVKNLPSGIYIVKATGKKINWSGKFIKE